MIGYGGMAGAPYDFAQQMCMDYFQMQPAAVKGRLNAATETERRYLYNKLFAVYKFTIPEYWPLNFFRFFLFYFGSIGAIYTKEYGWMAQPYGVTKLGPYYQPAVITVYNQFLRTEKTGILGVNAEIIRIMDDYGGLDDLVTKYAQKLADADKSININFMNANVSLMALVKNKKDADDIKTAYGQATEGKPLVVINKEVMEEQKLTTLIDAPKSNFMALEMLQARREIENQFLTDIGIRTANYDKRAQMSDDEVRQRDGESRALCKVILDNLNECFDKLNRISGLGCKVEFDEEVVGGGTIGQTDTVGDGAGVS